MFLSEISALHKDSALVDAGTYWYHHDNKKEPYTYVVRVITTDPFIPLYVKLPVTAEMKLKYKELRVRVGQSAYHMAEVTFDNFQLESHSEKLIKGVLKITGFLGHQL